MDSFEAKMFIGDYAPKQIWIDEHSEWWPTHSRSDTTPYIRADIVDELVEALKYCKQKIEYMHLPSELYSRGWAIDTANAALAKLEDV